MKDFKDWVKNQKGDNNLKDLLGGISSQFVIKNTKKNKTN